MSDISEGAQGGGKAPREKRRLSSDPPYKKLRSSSSAMPVATRHSPARDQPAPSQGHVPLGDIMHELSLLRQSMESKFSEAGKKSDSLRAEVVGKLEASDQAISELQLAVTDVTLSVDQNQRAIHEVCAEVERREIELPAKVKAIVNEALDRRPRLANTAGGVRPRPIAGQELRPQETEEPVEPPPTSSKEEAYCLARRSLRLWPVSREGDLIERTKEFMVNELCLDQQHAAELSIVVKRVGATRPSLDSARAASVRDEVLVRFESVRERDDVRSFVKNLERKGRGLRLEVPDHTWANFRILQQLGYELKLKNSKLRRNVLFDDACSNLKMDLSTDGTTWKTVLPAEAKRSLDKCRPTRARRLSMGREELDSAWRERGRD